MNRGYKYRLYPTKEQAEKIKQNIGSCRYVYNLALSWCIDAYNADRTCLSYTDLCYGIKMEKKFSPWLKDTDASALQQKLRDLERAFRNFFDGRTGYPKFKSKRKSRLSYRTMNNNNTLKIEGNTIHIPKVGYVKAVISRTAPDGWDLKSATVSMERDGTYYVSVLYEYDTKIAPPSIDLDNAIGLDYKSDGLFCDDKGNIASGHKFYRKSQKKLSKAQRKLSRMIESHVTGYRKGIKGGRVPVFDKPINDCKNIQKQRLKVSRIHRHASNQRLDFLHKLSTGIANRYVIVCVEDLNMRSLSNKGFGNGKATMDNGYGMFLNMLEYKLSDRGKYLIKVDKWYPSSQLCSCCGYKNPGLKDLKIRKWICPVCGSSHDRDYNSAVNIKTEGIRIFKEQFPKVG